MVCNDDNDDDDIDDSDIDDVYDDNNGISDDDNNVVDNNVNDDNNDYDDKGGDGNCYVGGNVIEIIMANSLFHLFNSDEIREEMKSLKIHTVLSEAKMNFPTNEVYIIILYICDYL